MLDPKYTKAVSAVISSQNETSSNVTLTGLSVEYSLCVRSGTTTNRGNYFVSFNLPPTSADFPIEGLTSKTFPELQQLNVEKIIISKIPYSAYSEYIDGRSFEISIPISGVSSTDYKLYSSTYSSDKALKVGDSSPMLGDNIAFLFCDTINSPYTGYTTNEIGQLVSHSAVTTWNPASRLLNDRPSAVSYSEIKSNPIAVNSDRRLVRNHGVKVPCGYPEYIGHSTCFYDTYFDAGSTGLVVNQGHNFHVGDVITVDKDDKTLNSSYDGIWTITSITQNVSLSYIGPQLFDVIFPAIPWGSTSLFESGAIFEGRGAYYNYDVPVGFVVLDKGFVVITHPKLVNNFYWTHGQFPDNTFYTGNSDDERHRVHFSAATNYIKYTNLDTEFKTSVVCMALNGEFYISNNRTWDRTVALGEFGNFNPVKITEVGLYNGLGELVGIGKFSNPVSRTVQDIYTFYINMKM